MSQPENRLSASIQEYLREHGAWCFKVHGSSLQPSGIPDILGVYQGQFIGVESKMPGNDLSEIQRFRIQRIRDAGGMVCIAFNLTDVKQFLYHMDTLHFSGIPGCSPFLCKLYGRGAGFDAVR